MKLNNRRASGAFLILGMVFLIIGISTDNTAFTWASIAFIVLSLALGGR
ncbi:MAG: hypothetical protein L6Q26_00780 [Anaerolineales bacterium]|nr:hypothetical protein [Anaerolineales bacterium]NUQ83518.1 hypothetical protein [Anaerolineales bacterium]